MRFERVDGDRVSPQLRGVEAAHDRSRVKPESKLDAAQPDQLSLSDAALELHGALKAVQAAPDVRQDRIAELQRRIADGTYHVPAETLATDILRGG